MNRLVQFSMKASWLLMSALALTACGFHLRQSAALPPAMQRVHLVVNGGGDLQRGMARALNASGVNVEEKGGPGIAEMRIPVATFSTETLSVGSYAQVTEYASRYHVLVSVSDSNGEVLLPEQNINMSREFSYDATNPIGNASQIEQIQRSLNDDMVQSILFRLQAAAKPKATPTVAPAAASSTN
ncbi:LPS assembly lipoprotein LptE [Dyella silvatica]|uniref:LPS-assembly lipoprotein LptE n=1 Tax=Dyella silvatica TaxID=2992128 RepID=UPI002B1CAE0E|nr:LPS assembly lipoprotein LptE [Dyella silvatica]